MVTSKEQNLSVVKFSFHLKFNIFTAINPTKGGTSTVFRARAGLQNKV